MAAIPGTTSLSSVGSLAEASNTLKLELERMDMRGPEDLDPLFRAAHQAKADVVILVGDPLIFQHRMRIHDLADQYRIATIQPTKEYLEGRGFLSYGPNLSDMIARAAVYADRILKGGKPADLPVEQPRKYELVVNLRSARVLGLTVPPSLLLRADQVIE